MYKMIRENITPDSLNMLGEPILGLSKVIDGYLLATNHVRDPNILLFRPTKGLFTCTRMMRWS